MDGITEASARNSLSRHGARACAWPITVTFDLIEPNPRPEVRRAPDAQRTPGAVKRAP
jgi:hypothetical protein